MVIFQSLLCGADSSMYFTLHWARCKRYVQTVVWKYWPLGFYRNFTVLVNLLRYNFFDADIWKPSYCYSLLSLYAARKGTSRSIYRPIYGKTFKRSSLKLRALWNRFDCVLSDSLLPAFTCIGFVLQIYLAPIRHVQTAVRVPVWPTRSIKLRQRGDF